MSETTEQPITRWAAPPIRRPSQATMARRAADEFAELLGTAAYPVGAKIAATRSIRDETGVSDSTAWHALRLLGEDGRLAVHHGMPSEVLPLPDEPPPPSDAEEALGRMRFAYAQLGQAIEQWAATAIPEEAQS